VGGKIEEKNSIVLPIFVHFVSLQLPTQTGTFFCPGTFRLQPTGFLLYNWNPFMTGQQSVRRVKVWLRGSTGRSLMNFPAQKKALKTRNVLAEFWEGFLWPPQNPCRS
jgi:hypothetical protein